MHSSVFWTADWKRQAAKQYWIRPGKWGHFITRSSFLSFFYWNNCSVASEQTVRMPEEGSLVVLASESAGWGKYKQAHNQTQVMLLANQVGTVSHQTVGRLSSVSKNRAGWEGLESLAVRRTDRYSGQLDPGPGGLPPQLFGSLSIRFAAWHH